jgi:translation initiation factor IF-3
LIPNQRPYGGNRGRAPRRELEHRINELIRVPEVRLVGENIEPGVFPTREALEMAQHLGVDLVEISPNAVPPVCRITDYNKFLYEKKKKEKEIKAHSKKVEIKEIRFTANTDEHDVDFKAKHAENFLQDGNKVRATLMFRGRAIVFKERGELLLLQFAKRLEEVASVEQLPTLEGKRMMMTLTPKGKKK